jgi:LysM repeat protein
VTVKALTDANPGVDPAKLKIGQTLHIPAAAAPTTTVTPASAANGGTSTDIYVVKSGDNLINIAKKFNTTVKAIRSANSLSTDSIKVGQKLKIPGKATTSSTPTTAPSAPADTTVPPAPTTPK